MLYGFLFFGFFNSHVKSATVVCNSGNSGRDLRFSHVASPMVVCDHTLFLCIVGTKLLHVYISVFGEKNTFGYCPISPQDERS